MSEKNFVSYGDAETLFSELGYSRPTWDELFEDVTKNVLTKKNEGNYWHANVSYTVDKDGIVTANGTAAINANSLLTIATLTLKAGKRYWLSGCPSGGGDQSYFIICGDGSNNVRDRGNGTYFTASSNETVVQIVIAKGITVTDLQFKPMLVLEKYKDEPFTPNIQSNKYIWDNALHTPEAVKGNQIDEYVLTTNKAGSLADWKRPNGVYVPIGSHSEFMSYDYDDGSEIARKSVCFRVILNTSTVFTSISALRQYAFDNGGIPIQGNAAPMSGYGSSEAFVGTPEFMGKHSNGIVVHVNHCITTDPTKFSDNKYEIVVTDRFIKEVNDTVTSFGNGLWLHNVNCITKTNQEYIADEGSIKHPVHQNYCMSFSKVNDRMVNNFG